MFIILFGYSTVSNIKYQKLKDEYNEMLDKSEFVADSLRNENMIRVESIKHLESNIEFLTNKFDSLNRVKVEVDKSYFVASLDISSSAKLLKDNLACTDVY